MCSVVYVFVHFSMSSFLDPAISSQCIGMRIFLSHTSRWLLWRTLGLQLWALQLFQYVQLTSMWVSPWIPWISFYKMLSPIVLCSPLWQVLGLRMYILKTGETSSQILVGTMHKIDHRDLIIHIYNLSSPLLPETSYLCWSRFRIANLISRIT